MDNDFIVRIYQEYYNTVLAIIWNLLCQKNPDNAADCVEEVFLIAIKKENLENHPNIEGWLYLTAKNVVAQFNDKNRITISIDSMNQDEKDKLIKKVDLVEEDFSTQLIEEIEYKRIKNPKYIKKALQTLTKREKDLYNLKYVKCLSNKQISKNNRKTGKFCKNRMYEDKKKI